MDLPENYDEIRVLGRYVSDHLPQLMTPFEARCQRALFLRIKSSRMAMPDEKFRIDAAIGDKDVDREIANGLEHFRARVTKRILEQRPEILIVNRCPECDRIVRTPKARQCLWCGHDWH